MAEAVNTLPPRPANAVFGLLVDGVVKGITFQSSLEAEQAAHGLVAQGRQVEIFDKVTRQVIKRL